MEVKKWFSYNQFTSPKTEWNRGAVVKELLARADELGSLPAKLFSVSFLYINVSVYFLFLIPFFPFRLFHFILFADSFPLCKDFAITYSRNLFVCVRVCVCGTA